MSNQKRMELIRVQYTRLPKLEFVSYVNNVIRIVDNHNPELHQIDCTFDLLVAESPQLKKLDVPYKAHPLTKIVTDLRRVRTVYVGSIFNHLRVVEVENSEDDISVNEVRIHLNRYLKNLKACKNEVERCEKVELFFDEIDKDKKLRGRFVSLKFTEHLDKLRNVHADIMKLGKDIIKSNSERPSEKTPTLRKSLMIAVEDLFKELEIAQIKNKDLDYKPLYDELNTLSTNYRNALSRRISHNKQKAEKNKELSTKEPEECAVETNSSQEVPSFNQKTFTLDKEELSKSMNGGKMEVKNKNGKDNGNGLDVMSLKQDDAVLTLTKYQQSSPVGDGD